MPPTGDVAIRPFILDNGGYTAKAGFVSDTDPRIIPNCITKAKNERRRQFIGDQIDDCKDMSGLFYIYPFQKGYIVNWEVMKQLWDYTFGREVCNVNCKETCLIITEPYFNFSSIQETTTEILFEDYGFHSILRINAGALSNFKYRKQHPKELCCLVVDSGFSFTYITPYIKGKPLISGIRRYVELVIVFPEKLHHVHKKTFLISRIDIGGKILTNHLKDIISYRQLYVMDETYVVNQVKEDVCYVSTDFWNDMKIAKSPKEENTIARDYVLPDYTVIKRGYVRPLEETTGKPKENEQIIRMGNERFQVPEILFHPSDIGVQEMGISEAIVHSIEAAPKEVQPHLYRNILLTGGNACFPGFRERVLNDVRAFSPYLYDVNVTRAENPVTNAWQGGSLLARDPEFLKMIVTQKQYEEHGMEFCLRKFSL